MLSMNSSVIIQVDRPRIKEHWAAKFQKDCPEEIFLNAQTFKETVENKWNQKQEIVIHKVEEMVGIDVAGTFNVFILPSELEEAQYLDEKTIEWGFSESCPNSIVIGLAHEIIHCITHDFYSTLSDDDKWFFHALVYLSADEEIRFVLNGKSEYFDSLVLHTYHPRLIETARNLLPYWKEYIANRNCRTIIDLFRELKSKS